MKPTGPENGPTINTGNPQYIHHIIDYGPENGPIINIHHQTSKGTAETLIPYLCVCVCVCKRFSVNAFKPVYIQRAKGPQKH